MGRSDQSYGRSDSRAMRSGRLVRNVAMLTTLSVFAVSAAVSAASQVSGPEDFRAELTGLLNDLDASIAELRTDPYLSDALDRVGADPEQAIATGLAAVDDLTAEDLEAMEDAFDASPVIGELDEAIDAGVSAASGDGTTDAADVAAVIVEPNGFANLLAVDDDPGSATEALMRQPVQATRAMPAVTAGTYTDNCESAGDPSALVAAVLVLNQLQSAAYAVVIAIPSVLAIFFVDIPVPPKIVAAVIYGVALAVYLALAQTLAVATDCAEGNLAATNALALPVAPANSSTPPPGTIVAGSSQISVDAALVAAGDVAGQANTIATNVSLVAGQVQALRERGIGLNTSLSCTTGIPASAPGDACGANPGDPVDASDVDARVNDVQSDLQTTQADIAVLRNTQTGILDKSNEEINAVAEFEALQVRMEIEANLSEPGFHAVVLFQLPAPWGYLETAAAITTEVVTAFGRGGSELADADAAFAAGQYKQAYTLYQKAYQKATK